MTMNRRKIRNYLIDRKMQLRITLVMVTLTSLLTAILGIFWYAEIRKASEVIRINAMSILGAEAATRLGSEMATSDHRRLFVLVGFAVVLGVLIAAYGIIMTHRIAGPLFKINRYVNDIAADRLYRLRGLRKGDQLQEFFGAFERMHSALRTRVEEDMKLLSEVIAAVDAERDLRTLVPVLRESLARKGNSLRSAGDVAP